MKIFDSEDWVMFWKIWFWVIAFILVVVALAVWASSVACEKRWVDSGRKYDWSLLGSCRVADKEGRLIPEKNIRDIQ